MIVGVDFDNTVANYDEVMYETALKRGLIAPDLARSKMLIRDAIRDLADGETQWRRLQTFAYGAGIGGAYPMDGIKKFFGLCKKLGIPVWIVSHKTEFNNFGEPAVNLRAAALSWLEGQGFFEPAGAGLDRARVFFESTREEKIERIVSLAITHYVDDLEETFAAASFPSTVEKIWFAPHGRPSGVAGIKPYRSWDQICRRILGPGASFESAVER